MNVMKIGVAQLPQLMPGAWMSTQATAVVIDTLRFTSTACVALDAGARAIKVMSDIEAARQLAVVTEPRMLLCGERHCVKIPGFDMGNSPLEYSPDRVVDRELIFSTTNGTVAVEAVQLAQSVALGSLLNRTAVSNWMRSQGTSQAWIVCAGTDGHIALEDVLTAGAILQQLAKSHRNIELLNDSAHLALAAWREVERENNLLHQLTSARGGRNLIESGFAKDVEFVAQLDRSRCVPERNEQGLFKAGELTKD